MKSSDSPSLTFTVGFSFGRSVRLGWFESSCLNFAFGMRKELGEGEQWRGMSPAVGMASIAASQGALHPLLRHRLLPGAYFGGAHDRPLTALESSVKERFGGMWEEGYGSCPQDVYWHYNPGPELYSRKVFVGGLPIDTDEDELNAAFSRFGPVVVDWPHKNHMKGYFPPKGYVFLVFEHEPSVQALVQHCHQEDDDKFFMCVSSPTMKDKPVQIRPWRLADADFVVDASLPLDPRKTVFIGGVPRPLKAVELAHIMDRLYGGVCYAGIDSDPELKYPKGAGRVSFSNHQSYIAAISAKFVQLQHADVDKRVEVKPYVLDDQMCDECDGSRCNGKYAPFFCPAVSCLQYYCEWCWTQIHSRQARRHHKPLIKENMDRAASRSPNAIALWNRPGQ